MATNKTVETNASVAAFLKTVQDPKRQSDCRKIVSMISKHTGIKPKMWGPAIIGFGSFAYKYESGREGTSPLVGLSPRVNAITLYLSSKFDDRDELLAKFGKHTTSKACIYVKKLEDIDTAVLMQMVENSIRYTVKKNNIHL